MPVFNKKKSQFLAVCSLNVFYVWMSCSKKNKIQFPDIVKTHTHTHRNPYSLTHTHTLLHTVENLLEKKKMCFPFFFFKIADIYMIFSFISVHSLRVLSKWSYVRYTIDQSRDAFFPHFCSKMNLNFNFYLSLLIECACLWICLFCNMISSL